ncbi:hypothetical protein BEH94_10475 [Candidatus Altiarchaeales archaeon WOR_SM1_SCG]|nr:hypothetical protein BEH94_10475 [Candidatus Altiarchaeales archaeon WOR_SM1_SCG]
MDENIIKNKIPVIEEKDKKINSFIVLDSSGVSRKDIAGEGKLKNLTIGIKSNINFQSILNSLKI